MLHRKVIRDIKENKGAYAACIIVIAIGLMVFTAYSLVMDTLTLAQQDFYKKQNFAEGFAEVRAMPYREAEKLRNIPESKTSREEWWKMSRSAARQGKRVYLRLVSLDPYQENPINGVRIDRGLPQLSDGAMHIWVDSMFFAANGLALNQEIEVIAEGRKIALRVLGTGQSPEFIYATRTGGDLPDREKFGIAYLPLASMQTLFSRKNTVNSIVFTLQPGAGYSSVEQELEPKLKPYGLERALSQERPDPPPDAYPGT